MKPLTSLRQENMLQVARLSNIDADRMEGIMLWVGRWE